MNLDYFMIHLLFESWIYRSRCTSTFTGAYLDYLPFLLVVCPECLCTPLRSLHHRRPCTWCTAMCASGAYTRACGSAPACSRFFQPYARLHCSWALKSSPRTLRACSHATVPMLYLKRNLKWICCVKDSVSTHQARFREIWGHECWLLQGNKHGTGVTWW